MIEITAEIRALIDKAAAGVELAGDEYIDPSDGLIHCKKCGGQRQTVVPCFGKSGYFMPHCICQCQREAEEQRKGASNWCGLWHFKLAVLSAGYLVVLCTLDRRDTEHSRLPFDLYVTPVLCKVG